MLLEELLLGLGIVTKSQQVFEKLTVGITKVLFIVLVIDKEGLGWEHGLRFFIEVEGLGPANGLYGKNGNCEGES